MTRTTSMKATAGALALIAASLATAACGRAGSLDRPGPMFGLARADEAPQSKPSGPSSAERRSKDTTSRPAASNTTTTSNTTEDAAADDENVPTTRRDLRDPAQRLTPLSASPIQGLPDPLGPPVSTKPPG